MRKMKIIETKIEGVVILEPVLYVDNRGYLCELFKEQEFNENVCEFKTVQENENHLLYGVLHGLHFQKEPYAQAKLARVVSGTVLNVAVDIRKKSPTFGKWVGVELSGENHRMLFLPKGVAHGMIALTDDATFLYKCDKPYAPDYEGAIAWDDPDLSIDWRVPMDKIQLSEKDKNHCRLKDSNYYF